MATDLAVDYDQLYEELAQAFADLGNATNPVTKSGTVGYLNTSGKWVIPVPGEGARIYVTIGTGVVEALNTGVSLLGGYPVVVIFVEGREPVAARPESSVAAEYMAGNTTLGTNPHSHRWGWANVDLLEGMRFEPGLTLPTDNGLEVSLTGFNYAVGGVRYYFPTTNVTPVESPTAGYQRWALIGVNTSVTPHAIHVVYGDEQLIAVPLTQSDTTSIDFPGVLSVGIRIANGQTDLHVIDDFVDLRAYSNNENSQRLVEIDDTDSPYSAGEERNIYCDTTLGDITVNLPALATNAERVYSIINVGTGTMTLDGYSTDLINGELTQVFNGQGDAPTIQATNSFGWWAK